jgi:hypothetical protein
MSFTGFSRDGVQVMVWKAVGSEVGSGVGGELDDFVGVEGVEAAGDALAVGRVPFAVALEEPGTAFVAEVDLGMGLAGEGDEFELLAVDLRKEVVAQGVRGDP